MSNNAMISLRFASHWNVPVFTTGGMEETFRDKSSEYRSLSCTVQYSTVQYSTVQYSTVQYSTVQYTCAVQVPHLPRRRLRPVRQVLRQADEAVLLAPRHLRLPPGGGMTHLCLLSELRQFSNLEPNRYLDNIYNICHAATRTMSPVGREVPLVSSPWQQHISRL